jgi:hypothetical protein
MDDTHPTEPLPGQPPQQPVPPAAPAPAEPFYKRHGLAFAISTLVLGVVLVFGMVGVGAFAIGSVVAHSGSTLSHLMHEGDGGQNGPQVPGRQGGRNGGNGGNGGNGNGNTAPFAGGVVRGTVTSISGDSWKISTRGGGSVTVTTTSSTAFGLPGQSGSSSDFAKGDEVIVVGKRSGDTVTASRILKLDDFPMRPPSTPGSSTPGPSTPGS